MNRFWVFPLVLGVIGALFPTLAWLEGVVPLMWSIISRSPLFWQDIISTWCMAAPWGMGIGVVLGLIVGAVDSFRNGRAQRRAGKLVGNVAWCLLYAHVLIAVDAFPSTWMSSRLGWRSLIIGFLAFIPFLLGLITIAWATIRTITTDDVLSPRVLLQKLRRSTQLLG